MAIARLIVIACWAATSEAGAAIVQFAKTAEVGTSVIHLRDVADVHGLDSENEEQLQGIILGPAPAPGRQTLLEFVTIRSRLQAQGIDLARTEFSGSSTILVTRSSVPEVTESRPGNDRVKQAEDMVAKAVQDYWLRQTALQDSVAISIQLNEADVTRILSVDATGFRVVSSRIPSWNTPYPMIIEFVDRSGKKQQVQFVCRISQRPTVVTVRYTVPRGHVLRQVDLAYQQTDNTIDGFNRVEDVVGKEVVRTLRKDAFIRVDDVQAVPLVRRGDIVTVYSRAPGISVKRPFKSRDEASLGDSIALTSLDGRERIVARVSGYHEAEVIGSDATTTADTFGDATGRIRFGD